MFLDGRHDELSRELVTKMREAAADAQFELAAVYRDQLRAIENVREEQRVVTEDRRSRRHRPLPRGRSRRARAPARPRGPPRRRDDVLAEERGDPRRGDRLGLLDRALRRTSRRAARDSSSRSRPTARRASRSGRRRRCTSCRSAARAWSSCDLANENARHAFAEKPRTTDDVQERLAQLQERLRLPTLPRRIECCDISHLGGGDTVGAIVAMHDGQPDKKHYRTFNVKGPAGSGAATTTTARCTRCSRAASAAANARNKPRSPRARS